jgi:excisionase family DNA binding protein
MKPDVFTPATLASYWQCSERHVRNLINRGELRHVRLGGKLLRIRISDVEDFECRNGGSQNCSASIASPGTKETSADVIDLEQMTHKRRAAAPRLDTPSLRDRRGRP